MSKDANEGFDASHCSTASVLCDACMGEGEKWGNESIDQWYACEKCNGFGRVFPKVKKHRITKRTMYGVVWECVKPGLWKSECGWYSATRRWVGGWEGRDLETGRSIFGESLMSVVYEFKRGSK